MLRAAIVAAACALCALPAAASAASSRLLAGAGVADITPPTSSPMFAYTSRSFVFSPDPGDPSNGQLPPVVADRGEQMVYDPDTGFYAKTFRRGQGIHTRVLSRALVFERKGVRYALVQADLGGLPYALTQEVVRRIADTGITADHLLLSATHTHSSTGAIWPADNSGYAFVGGDAFDPRIFELTAAGVSAAIHQAVSRLEPAKAGVAAVQNRGASRNRSFEAFQRDTEVKNLPIDQQRLLSIDPTVTVIRVDSARDGHPIAVWSNFAKHPTTMDDLVRLFSGDSAGAAARWTEQGIEQDWEARGGTPGADPAPVDVWTNGAQGDISSDGDQSSIDGQAEQYDESDAAHADLAGRRDARGILAAWRDAGTRLTDKLPIKARRTLISFDGTSYGPSSDMEEPVGPIPVLGQGGIVQDDGTCAPVNDMAGPGQGAKEPLLGGPGITPTTFPVSFWQVGDLGIAAYPAEITKEMGQRIREDLLARSGGAFDRVVIAGLTNAYISYTTTPEEYDYCGYEGSFTLFGREEGYAWMAFGQQLESNLLHGTPLKSQPEPPDFAVGNATTTPARPTPDAGTITAQPDATMTRYGRAVMKWTGGDEQVDPERDGHPFVTLQHKVGDSWDPIATDDSLSDTTARANGEWTETWQFDQCTTPGIYRLHVTGMAIKNPGEAASGYTADSREITVTPVPLTVDAPAIDGDSASVRPIYPDPGKGALLALPRLVRDAQVSFDLADGSTVTAQDDGTGLYRADTHGSPVTAVHVADGCGNTGSWSA
jgi:neutral ceramidase